MPFGVGDFDFQGGLHMLPFNSNGTMKKICASCLEVKALTEFYKDLKRKDGYYTRCIACQKKSVKKRIIIRKKINLAIKNLQYDVQSQQFNKGKAQISIATLLQRTSEFAEYEDMRKSDNNGILKIGVSQSIAWPGLYKAQRNLYGEQLKYYQANTVAIEEEIKKNVRSVY